MWRNWSRLCATGSRQRREKQSTKVPRCARDNNLVGLEASTKKMLSSRAKRGPSQPRRGAANGARPCGAVGRDRAQLEAGGVVKNKAQRTLAALGMTTL